jgi:hypothetical protein
MPQNVLSQSWKSDRPFLRAAIAQMPQSWANAGIAYRDWLKYLNFGGPYADAQNGTPNPPPMPAGYGPENWAHTQRQLFLQSGTAPAFHVQPSNVLSQGWKQGRPYLRQAIAHEPASWVAAGDSYEEWLKYLNFGGPYATDVNPDPPPIAPGWAPEHWADHLRGFVTSPMQKLPPTAQHHGQAMKAAYGIAKLQNLQDVLSDRAAWHLEQAAATTDKNVKTLLREIRQADGSLVQVQVPITPAPAYGTVEFSRSNPNGVNYDPTQDPMSAQFDVTQSDGGYGESVTITADVDPTTQSWTPPVNGPTVALGPESGPPPGWSDLGDGTCADPTGSFGMSYADAWEYYMGGSGHPNAANQTGSNYDGTADGTGTDYPDGGYGGPLDTGDGTDVSDLIGQPDGQGGVWLDDGSGGVYSSLDQGAVDYSASYAADNAAE